MDDLISRKEVIKAIEDEWDGCLGEYNSAQIIRDTCEAIDRVASAQPDGITLEWIDKHLEWLDNCDNDFAQLAKVSIRAMVEIWKKDRT